MVRIADSEDPFVDLRRLVDWFATRPTRPSLHVEKIVERLGPIAVPLLGRELRSREPCRRDAARAALAQLATTDARDRVIAELRAITRSGASDEEKTCAVGLLGELGERGAARFTDPLAIQRRSAVALAGQLESASDVAAAADLMVRQMQHDEITQLLGVMADAVPASAQRLGRELCARLDLARELREQIAEVTLVHGVATPITDDLARRAPRPTHVSVLVDAAARLVVVASRKLSGERRWRRWAVLIDASGRIDDCIHEDHAGTDGDAAGLIASLVADGYRVSSTELERARELVAAAARRTGAAADARERLPSAYYLGRDLLDLGEAHLDRARVDPTSATLGRAVELIADGELSRAQDLLARCDGPGEAEVAAAIAACLLAQQRPAEAIAHLARAIELEPTWPLHHWNLAAACHQLGDAVTCYHALGRFVATSATPSGLYGDPDQPGRVAVAIRLMAELERCARLAGAPLARPRRKRRTTKRSAAPR